MSKVVNNRKLPKYRCPKCGNVTEGNIIFTHTSRTDGDKEGRYCLRCFIGFLDLHVPETELVEEGTEWPKVTSADAQCRR